jgi:hypothetical protein
MGRLTKYLFCYLYVRLIVMRIGSRYDVVRSSTADYEEQLPQVVFD